MPMSCSHPDPELCRRCNRHVFGRLWELYQTRADYRDLLERLAIEHGKKHVRSRFSNCRYLGSPTGEEISCGTCPGNVRLKVLHCTHPAHGRTTARQCAECMDWEADPGTPYGGPVVRNLAYHICPFEWTETWQRNLDHLKRRWTLFNGKKVIAIATGDYNLATASEVQQYMGRLSDEVEWIVLRNVPNLRELVSWKAIWKRVHTSNPQHVTFYAHAKGVTKPVNPGVSVHAWTDIMYETCLDYWPIVERLLRHHPIAGSLQKIGNGFLGPRSTWHYSGAFFWVRNCMVSWKQLTDIDRQWWGTEAWVGRHWPAERGGVIFHRGWVPDLNMYLMDYLTGTILPELQQWREANREFLWKPQA